MFINNMFLNKKNNNNTMLSSFPLLDKHAFVSKYKFKLYYLFTLNTNILVINTVTKELSCSLSHSHGNL